MIAFYRIPSFFKGLYNATPNERAKYCIDAALDTFIDLPFLLMGAVILVTIYRFVGLMSSFKQSKKSKRVLTWECFVCLLLDIPAFSSFAFIYLTRYRLPVLRERQSDEKKKNNFLNFHTSALSQGLELFVDVLHMIISTPIIITLWRAPHLYSSVFIDIFYSEKFYRDEEEEEDRKLEMVSGEIFNERRAVIRGIIVQWFIDIIYIAIGLLSLWRIPRIVLHYMSIITNQEKAGSMRNKALEEFIQSILDVLAISGIILFIAPTFYRIPTLISRLRTEDKLYQLIVFSEVKGVIFDLPFIIMGVLSLWRIPVLIAKIWVWSREEYSTAEKRRELAKEQFIDALFDIPFVVSFVLMILSIMHIFTLYLLTKKYYKFKKEATQSSEKRDHFKFFRGKILKQLYLLPLQIPLIICTYLVTFTVYRIPITIETMKKIPGQKEPKKLAAKVILAQAISVPADIICLLFSVIITLTYYRVRDLRDIFKRRSLFTSSFEIKESLAIHKEIALVFWNVVKDIPLIILFLVSSITIWRVNHIWRAINNEPDYYKRLALLSTNALLTVSDIPCLACALLVLLSWRGKRMATIIKVAYMEGKLSIIHWSIFVEFYELILDYIHIALVPFTLWRIPVLIRNAMKVS